jgi:FtsH-binding integral membrane protein
VDSYKKQLGWNEERTKAPDIPRKPIATLLALATAVVTGGLSVGLYFNAPSGFEGYGSMLMSLLIGFVGVPVALILCFVAFVREKSYRWANLISIVICLANVVWLFSQI